MSSFDKKILTIEVDVEVLTNLRDDEGDDLTPGAITGSVQILDPEEVLKQIRRKAEEVLLEQL